MKKYIKQAPILLVIPILLVLLMNWNDLGGGEGSVSQQNEQYIDKLEKVLETIEGVGVVKVYYYDQHARENASLTNYFTEKGTANEQSVQGILVVAEGGDDPYIRTTLSKAITTIFQLAEHQVMIVEMEKGRTFIEDE